MSKSPHLRFGEVTRHEWGALESKARTDLWNPVMKILLLYGTETKPCTTREECRRRLKAIQIDHMYCRKWPDINYNFMIGGDGNVYEGRGFSKKPTPISDYVANSLIIAFIGDWSVIDPPQMYQDILSEFCRLYVREGKIHQNYENYFIRGF